MRWYLDTEFNEDDTSSIDLISIALVNEADVTYYAHLDTYSPLECNDWVKEHVLPHLEGIPRKPASLVRREVLALVGPTPEFWGYYADYDWVLFCKLFGTMVQLPKGWPKFCLDVRQQMHDLRVTHESLPIQTGAQHDALADARWIREAKWRLDDIATNRHLHGSGGIL